MRRLLHWLVGDDWGIRSIDGHAPPDSTENRARFVWFALPMAAGFMAIGLLSLAFVAVLGSDPPGVNLGWALGGGFAALLVFVPVMGFALMRLPIAWLSVLPAAASVVALVLSGTLGTQHAEPVAVSCAIISLVVGVALQRRAAYVHLAILGIGYGLLLRFVVDVPNPGAMWLGTIGGSYMVATAVGSLLDHIRHLAAAEREASTAAASAQAELTALNDSLEQSVADQVADLDRLSRLERFLPGPVVDVVLSDGQDLLEPHRREIAVFFCDLRGFTAFAGHIEPEEVHKLLTAYFDLLGEHLRAHEATVGAFTGDGLMAFFNDPLPCPDPAHRAVDLALALQRPIDELLGHWRRQGYALGFGVGIALGYADIGMIGFEGRRDYTALGPVVNLASRLCGEAAPGTVMIDARANAAVEGLVPTGDAVSLQLKGYDRPVVAYPVDIRMHA